MIAMQNKYEKLEKWVHLDEQNNNVRFGSVLKDERN